ncbi:MAG: N-acetylmuramoyl-L-alanine amidase [Candidatus Eremiobacteraeota bacterium]|nr:N-acetylmuramoyl-L-alanine amidase [Candidatus Eremiobacteraeota bacterium]MCW5871795.1 N-acetylmuramoyl-L-alanine amidase [Candidatus Eremiobacteraeota bacterium]
MKKLLSLLFLTGAAWAEPQVFPAAEPVQGRVLLVAEDGQKEAAALAGAGIECLLSRAKTPEELSQDWKWAQNEGDLTLIGLGARAPLAWQSKVQGMICLDANPHPGHYTGILKPTVEGVDHAKVDPERGLPYERSLNPAQPLFLVAPETSDEICQQLQGNVHKAAGSLAEANSAVQKEVRRWIAIQQPLPVIGLPDSKFIPSPNWGVRSLGDKIDTVVVHSTVINTLEGTERAFWDDKERRVSAHYVVDRDGTTVQMVDERRTAWHAGVSELEGRTGVNDFSVGIELVNLNDGRDPYTEAQYQAVQRIIQDLRGRWEVPDSHIVSHAAIARPVGRKSDPVGFDFAKLLKML